MYKSLLDPCFLTLVAWYVKVQRLDLSAERGEARQWRKLA